MNNSVYSEEQYAALYRVIEVFEQNGFTFSHKEEYGLWGEDRMVGRAEVILQNAPYSGGTLFGCKILDRRNGSEKDVNISIYYISEFVQHSNFVGRKMAQIKLPIKCTERVFQNRMKKALAACEPFKGIHGCFF